MVRALKNLLEYASRHRYGLTLLSFLLAASLTGVASVLFMRTFDFVLGHRLDFARAGAWCWITTPLLFLLSVELIRRAAPCAAGTGIPQAIFAAKHLSPEKERLLEPLLSPATLVVKIAALLIAILAGASTGREGPTVHVAACIFFGIIVALRRWTGQTFDLRSVVVAGGASGLAAAFNTPLAGVTFAVEELTVDYFSSIKDFVLMAIIIAAISAKVLTGEYAYFGVLRDPLAASLPVVSLISLAGGLAGAFFSSAILWGQARLAKWDRPWGRYMIPVACSLGLLLVAWLFGPRVLGPGNVAAKDLVQGRFDSWALGYPAAKIAATLLTYWSGCAGGIFAPCLSIGAALGADIGNWVGSPPATCALVGMAAFLSGTIQAPITSFVIIFEMTGHHQMLLPIMLAALLGFMAARLTGARHLYQALAENYSYLLGGP